MSDPGPPPDDVYSLIRFQDGPFDAEWRRIEQDALNQTSNLTFFLAPKDPLGPSVRATYQYSFTDTETPPWETIAEQVDVYVYVGSAEDYGTLDDFHH